MKNKKIENVCLKFHNIVVILEFLVGLAMYNGHLMKILFVRKTIIGRLIFSLNELLGSIYFF